MTEFFFTPATFAFYNFIRNLPLTSSHTCTHACATRNGGHRVPDATQPCSVAPRAKTLLRRKGHEWPDYASDMCKDACTYITLPAAPC